MSENRAASLRRRIRELENEVRVANELLRDRRSKLTLAKNELFELTYPMSIWCDESVQLMEAKDDTTL